MGSSIVDVAKRANVSISTVSRVLNRRDLVNERTRLRVEEAIRALGYRPNMFARGLMLQKSEMLGLVLPDLHGEFYSEVIRGANLRARELGYVLVIASIRGPDDAHILVEDLQRRAITDGLALMFPEQTDDVARLLAGFRVPVVIIDGSVDGGPYDSVVIDQRGGAMAMMRHLIEDCRCRRILFVGGLRTNVDTIARLDAYRQSLTDAGLAISPEDIHHLDYQYETAFEYARRHVRDWAGAGHCVFAANDEMASGIVDAAAAAGIEVPRDLAVVGFDDTRVARMTRPPLTTVHVPMSQMGATAIELLCRRMADPQHPPVSLALRPQLVVRESCGAARHR
jgi:LacI family transcriptional regulator